MENTGTIQPLISPLPVQSGKGKQLRVGKALAPGVLLQPSGFPAWRAHVSWLCSSATSTQHSLFHTKSFPWFKTPRDVVRLAGKSQTLAEQHQRLPPALCKLPACYFTFFIFMLLHLGSCDSCGFPSGCRAGRSQVSSVCDREELLGVAAARDRCTALLLVS